MFEVAISSVIRLHEGRLLAVGPDLLAVSLTAHDPKPDFRHLDPAALRLCAHLRRCPTETATEGSVEVGEVLEACV